MNHNRRSLNKLVEELHAKSPNEFNKRAYSIAELYFEEKDYENCIKYVEIYLEFKNDDGAAHKLLGQALHKQGIKQQALEQYQISLEIDPLQPSTIYLEICELLADGEVTIDPIQAQIWCDQADAIYPRHPIIFPLKERLISMSDPNPEALVMFVRSELTLRPKDVHLHDRLLNYYLDTNNIKKAYDHACKMEFEDRTFINDYHWYESLNKLLKYDAHDVMDWLYQLLLLTVRERVCLLSITETPSGTSKSIIECEEHLYAYDQAIDYVEKLGGSFEYAEFHTSLLEHHRGQISLHAATLMLKKAKQCKLSWKDATTSAAPLMLTAWQTVPLDPKVIWLITAPEDQELAVKRWYIEGTYRCSQAGHYLLYAKGTYQSLLDSNHWRAKCYKNIFSSKNNDDNIGSSYFMSDIFNPSVYRTPENSEVQAYDKVVLKEYADSLHHIIWMALKYNNLADFHVIIFDMPDLNATTYAPETLNELDIYAFIYCATLSQKQKSGDELNEKPTVLPANISGLMCTPDQIKWWKYAYKFSHNELDTNVDESTDLRAILSKGKEVLNCVDNHGLDPELLCILGRIFSERSKKCTVVDDINQLEQRACLYYKAAIPLLRQLKIKIPKRTFHKSMFSYTHKELSPKELHTLLEECILFVAINYINNGEYEEVIETISNFKSPEVYYYLSQTYKKIALEQHHITKLAVSLSQAETFALKALNMLSEGATDRNNCLYIDLQELIEEIRSLLNKTEFDITPNRGNDHNLSISQYLPNMNDSYFYTNGISPSKANSSFYQSHMCISRTLQTTAIVRRSEYNKIENEIKYLQEKDKKTDLFIDKTVSWFQENRKMSNTIISAVQTNMQYTKKQFSQLQSSIDQVKDEMKECKNEYEQVHEIKKDIAEIRKEFDELKKEPIKDATPEMNNYLTANHFEPTVTLTSANMGLSMPPLQTNQIIPSSFTLPFSSTPMRPLPANAVIPSSYTLPFSTTSVPPLPADVFIPSSYTLPFSTTSAPPLPVDQVIPSSYALSFSTTSEPPIPADEGIPSSFTWSFSTTPAPPITTDKVISSSPTLPVFTTPTPPLPADELFPSSYTYNSSSSGSDSECSDDTKNILQLEMITSTNALQDSVGNNAYTEHDMLTKAERYIVNEVALSTPVETKDDETETNDTDLHTEKIGDDILPFEPSKLSKREDEQSFKHSDSGEDWEQQRPLKETHSSDEAHDESSRTNLIENSDSREDYEREFQLEEEHSSNARDTESSCTDKDSDNEEEEVKEEYTCVGEAMIRQGNGETYCAYAYIHVMLDPKISAPKIRITDAVTNETLADTAICTINKFKLTGDTCMWTAENLMKDLVIDETVTIGFFDNSTALQFYDHYQLSQDILCY